MLNSVNLVGRLTRDPELRYTASGKAVTGFTLAVQRSFENAQGEREVDFIDVVAWGGLAETCGSHLAKGRLVTVEGRLQARTWEGKDGMRHKTVEVVAHSIHFLDRPKGEQAGNTGYTAEGTRKAG
jgi:single-strand DNA-binding protein